MDEYFGCTYDEFEMMEDNGDQFDMQQILPGPGVAPGGTTDQALLKRTDANFDTYWGNIVKKNQGAGNVGKAMVVDENGDLVPQDITISVDTTLHVAGAAADAKAVGDAIAAYYNSATSYVVGDYCLYNGVLYRCTAGGSNHTPGSGSAYWTATTIMAEAGSGVSNSIATAFSTSSSKNYAVGDYVVYQRGLYRCTGATTGGTWDSAKWTAAILADDVNDLRNTLSNLGLTVVDGKLCAVYNVA